MANISWFRLYWNKSQSGTAFSYNKQSSSLPNRLVSPRWKKSASDICLFRPPNDLCILISIAASISILTHMRSTRMENLRWEVKDSWTDLQRGSSWAETLKRFALSIHSVIHLLSLLSRLCSPPFDLLFHLPLLLLRKRWQAFLSVSDRERVGQFNYSSPAR